MRLALFDSFNGAEARRPRKQENQDVRSYQMQPLQWSRGPKASETYYAAELGAEELKLQWSRGPKASETTEQRTVTIPIIAASMEPRPEGLGNTAINAFTNLASNKLQWSRGPKASETCLAQ